MATRIVAGVPQAVTRTFYTPGTEGTVDADAGVTVSVVHVNGYVVLPAGTAATHNGSAGSGSYSITIPAQATVADLIVTWTGTFGGSAWNVTDYVSVVGSYFFELAELRAMDGLAGNAGSYPTSALINARENAETLFEQATGRHWTRKYARETLDGDQKYRRGLMVTDNFYFIQLSRRLGLANAHPRTLLFVGFDDYAGRIVTDGVTTITSPIITSATAAFTANTDIGMLVTGAGIPQYATIASVQSATQATLSANATASGSGVSLNLGGGEYSNGIISQSDVPGGYKLYSSGEIERLLTSSGWPRGVENVVLEYVHGENLPPPDMKRAALKLARHMLLEDTSRTPDNAKSLQTDVGQFELGTASGWQRPTGLPYVDAVIERYGEIQQYIA